MLGMPSDLALKNKIWKLQVCYKNEKFDEKSSQVRYLFMSGMDQWINALVYILYNQDDPRRILFFDYNRVPKKLTDESIECDMTDRASFCRYMDVKEFFDTLQSGKTLQSSAMIYELFTYQFRNQHYGIMVLFEKCYFYLDIVIDWKENSIFASDFLNLCYRTCAKCCRHSMDDMLDCKMCKKEYCSMECMSQDKLIHKQCLQKFEVLRCRVCGEENCILKCSKCKKARYCSQECQRKDWKNHKYNCFI